MEKKKETTATNLPPCLQYGLSHSKRYVPSPIREFLVERDAESNFIKMKSDVHLLLHQKDMQKHIGTSVIQRYIDEQRQSAMQSLIPHENLTDDELFNLIEPKEVNNITTAYEFAKYLQSNSKEFNKRYNDAVEAKRRVGNMKYIK